MFCFKSTLDKVGQELTDTKIALQDTEFNLEKTEKLLEVYRTGLIVRCEELERLSALFNSLKQTLTHDMNTSTNPEVQTALKRVLNTLK